MTVGTRKALLGTIALATLCPLLAGCPKEKDVNIGACHLTATLTPSGHVMTGEVDVTCDPTPVVHNMTVLLLIKEPGETTYSSAPGGLADNSTSNLPPVTVKVFGPCVEGISYWLRVHIIATFKDGPPINRHENLKKVAEKGDCSTK